MASDDALAQTGGPAGERFGRIPRDTVDLFGASVRLVRDEVATALPPSAGESVRAYTIQTVLEIVLRDWRENSNTTGLLPADVVDLKSFISLAATVAGPELGAGGSGVPVFESLLKGLLEDWLANWNSPGDPGPPGPG